MMLEEITLSTGYKVHIEEGWEQHLFNALLGEIVLKKVESAGSWDEGCHLLVQEANRISREYNLSFCYLLRGVFALLEKAADSSSPPAPNRLSLN